MPGFRSTTRALALHDAYTSLIAGSALGRDFWLLLILGTIWGANFLFMKIAVQVITPTQVAWMRVVFGALPIGLYALSRKQLRWSDRKWTHHYLALSLLSTVVPFLCLTKATQYLKSGAAGAMSGVVPLVTVCFSLIFLPDERLSRRKALGILFGFIGLAVLVNLPALLSNASPDNAYGYLCMMIAAVGFAGAAIYTKRFLAPLKISPIALACYQTVLAAAVLTLVVPFAGLSPIFHDRQALIAVILGLGLVGTGIGFILYFYLIEKLGAVTASSVFYIPPLVALSIGSIVAGESLEISQAIGAALILFGVWLSRNTLARTIRV